MRIVNVGFVGTVILLVMLFTLMVSAEDFTLIREPSTLPTNDLETDALTSTRGERATYTGTVRLYIVEPVSRWQDSQNKDYNYALLDFALVTGVTISDLSTWSQSVIWSGSSAGYGDITENNIGVIAVAFNSEYVVQNAYPPDPQLGYWFNAYYVDAAAEAEPGTPGQNEVNQDFTHTVFIEEGTATW